MLTVDWVMIASVLTVVFSVFLLAFLSWRVRRLMTSDRSKLNNSGGSHRE